MKRLTILALGLLILAACSHPWHGSGTVTAKRFLPAHDYETTGIIAYLPQTIESCSYIGSSESCYPQVIMQPMYGPVTEHAGDEWVLAVTDAEGKTHRLSVSERVYNSLNLSGPFDSKVNR
jgi:hypothetical protein